ncbi:hypothetical protein BU24DRAFT_417004 [Aaosphaeria arxii CBS 175.79]|uniref:Uncharacterized protein n=1 Tax=Aaosphaeria arxii CBS 175.79 TaxID=1450172 RepID=A0A6A5Y730_9PLEO|nr:uncharacterized protein BU24DRAFT_417004 [Aaosphaeria arxii CBS 175.79]KAF2021338.1 hypothetical protein BU24DRAFT_417004 [Aaosphaeria arxii CBS 175.79]
MLAQHVKNIIKAAKPNVLCLLFSASTVAVYQTMKFYPIFLPAICFIYILAGKKIYEMSQPRDSGPCGRYEVALLILSCFLGLILAHDVKNVLEAICRQLLEFYMSLNLDGSTSDSEIDSDTELLGLLFPQKTS